MAVKTSYLPTPPHPLPFPILETEEGEFRELFHLMLGGSFSGNLGNYLRSLKALLLKAIYTEV